MNERIDTFPLQAATAPAQARWSATLRLAIVLAAVLLATGLIGMVSGSLPFARAADAPSGNYLKYNGGDNGTFTESPVVYLIFYGNQWGGNGGDTQRAAEGFLKGLGTGGETWSRTLTQYCTGQPAGTRTCPDNAQHIPYPDGRVFGGTWFDDAAPATDTMDWEGIGHAAADHFNAGAALSRSIFVVLSPTPTAGGGNGWHTTLNGYNIINLPSNENNTVVLSHEYAEAMTDVNGGWTSPSNEEIADMCGPGGDLQLPTGSFPVTSLWSNSANACSMGS